MANRLHAYEIAFSAGHCYTRAQKSGSDVTMRNSTRILSALCLVSGAATFVPSYAATFETIYSFPLSERLGQHPFGKLALGADGNFYGTTTFGGAANEGTVFKVTPGGRLTSLYSFAGGADGSRPYAGVVIDEAGTLFGTTLSGGTFNAGTVYRLAPDGTETVLHSFGGSGDGASPIAALTADQSGNLYGVTTKGGHGGGTLFMVTPAGAEKVLHEFVRNDGTAPRGRLYLDKSGNIYGTAANGGNDYTGTVFRLTPQGNFSVLHDFDIGSVEGAKPLGGLVPGRKGELYGTTYTGAGVDQNGTVYSIKPDGTEALVYAFPRRDGNEPICDLVVDAKGNLYGTTLHGGHGNQSQGLVFKLTPAGKETVLHSFTGPDGAYPYAGLTADGSGNFYGVTEGGSKDNTGTVFKITP